jgi:F0F1-type ATP synthase delta subunit
VISRAQVASYVADKLPRDRGNAIMQAAAWLVATGRQNQARYLTRDVAHALAQRGYLLVRVESARTLSPEAYRGIESYIVSDSNAQQVEFESIIDPSLIGGVKIETPGRELDASVRRKLAKFVEGVNA